MTHLLPPRLVRKLLKTQLSDSELAYARRMAKNANFQNLQDKKSKNTMPNNQELTEQEKKDLPWWKILPTPTMGSLFDPSWASGALVYHGMNGGPKKLEVSRNGELAPDLTIADMLKTITDLGGVCAGETYVGKVPVEYIFVWQHTLLSVNVSFNNLEDNKLRTVSNLRMDVESNNQEYFDKLSELSVKFIDTKKRAGKVFILVSTEYGPEFEPIGIGGHSIERENYSPEVLVAYDKILSDLRRTDPTGRLSILNGPPGTGKTYLVKAIVQEDTNSTCIIIPSQYVKELTSPSIVPALLNIKKNNGGEKSPILFLIEDADECLVARESGDMSSISAVLNLCDGIIGSLLDIRMLATTNANKMDLDKALTRPGRLSANVEVKALTHDNATKVLKRIAGPDAELPAKKSYTLAEIYNFHKEGSVKAVGIGEEKKGMGFSV